MDATSPAPASMANAESLKNKAKITSTSVSIAASNFFDQSTTNKTFYNDTSATSRQQNTGLDALTNSYITGSHWKTGYGGFAGQSEQSNKFAKQSLHQSKNSISPDRIKFFKDSHFNHNKPAFPLEPAGTMRSDFDKKQAVNRNVINRENNAFRLKDFRHDYGQIGVQASNMVSDNHMRYKWVQPRDVDYGRTASMGF